MMLKESYIWYCDLCGKEYSRQKIPLFNKKYRIEVVNIEGKHRYAVDLCKSCRRNLLLYLKDNCEKRVKGDE